MQNTNKISGFALAPQQKRIWSLQQTETSFWTQGAILIEGKLDINLLQTTLEKLVNSHDILRTSFRRLVGMKLPLMVINDFSKNPLNYFEIELAENEENWIKSLFQAQRSKKIDFDQDCLLNSSLYKLSESRFILHLSLPALCSDAWTIQSLFTQITKTYQACLEKRQINQPSLQYWQFSEWHNQLFEEEEAEEGKAYWQQQKVNFPPVLLPFETQELDIVNFKPDFFSLDIDQELCLKIETFAENQNTSVEIVLLSIWQVLIWRLSGQSEGMITVSCERRDDELNNLLGLVGADLPYLIQLTPDWSFQDVLNRVQLKISEHSEWQDYFVSEPISDNKSEVFRLGFEFITLPESDFINGVNFSLIAQDNYLDFFNIKLSCFYSKPDLSIKFNYNIKTFSEEGIKRIAQQFKVLLVSSLTNPKLPINQLNILSEQDRKQLLVEFNPVLNNLPEEKCIHHLFEHQAELTPNKIAVVFEEEQLTYAELNAKANQLAHFLHKQGIKNDSIVGIIKPRSLEIIIIMLGILKAGAAYLPLDPNLPAEGLNFRLKDAQVSHIIGDLSLAGKLDHITIIDLDQDPKIIADESQNNSLIPVNPENLIYVLYTSGSTGQPKGVMIEHRHLFNYIHSILNRLEFAQDANFALISTFTADLGNTVIFPALCTGGCLHIISQERAMNPDALAQYCDRYPIDYLKIVPSHLNALLNTTHPEKIIPKKGLILGGEALNWQLVEKLKSLAPNCSIVNHYGPTETTVGVLTYTLTNDSLKNSVTVPLGRPLPHVKIYILDEVKQLVPIGVAGELYIGGNSVARGYLNRPQLTEERFLTDIIEGEKLYKTGDRVRYLPDGTVEFLGRTDNQVKLRGFRLELEEIEALLNQHEGVRQSVASVWEKEPGQQQLIAYIVPHKEHNLSPISLQNFLLEKLPDYAIPSGFLFLTTLPLTANGKVDRKALPTPDEESLRGTSVYVAPRTSQEAILSQIWANILKVERVGIDDNFFQLGGHSLLATQVISAINNAFDLVFPLRYLFEFPTIRDLAKCLNSLIQEGKSRKVPPITPVSRDLPLASSFAQNRLWFLEQLHPDSCIYNSSTAIRLKGNLNIKVLVQSLNEMIKRHEILRTAFKNTKNSICQVIAPSLTVDLPLIDLSQFPTDEREKEVQKAIASVCNQPFDLSQAPLLRGLLLELGEQEYILIFAIHHIIIDGWSIGVFIQELATIYRDLLHLKPISLPDLPIQYADFTVWQHQWIQGEILEEQLAYWTEKLTDLPMLSLPTIRSRETLQTHQGSTLSFTLPSELSTALQKLSQQENVTLFMTLLAGFQVLLQRYTHQDDLVVGTDIANRNQPQTEGLIGFFVNLLVLRTDLSGNPNFIELLSRVREVTLEAYTHQDLPFEKLVEVLQPDRYGSQASPLFQVLFVLQNVPLTTLELPGVELQPLELANQKAKFDLSLIMEETPTGIQGKWEYNQDLFAPEMIAQMSQHFQNILSSAVEFPNLPITQLSFLSPQERQKLLFDWNQTTRDYPLNKCIHQLIEEQVQKTPNAIAIIFEDHQLTYRQLNERANQLAHHLQTLGVAPDVLVGICLERSLEMLIGLLGILKAGGAYIPLDPAYPPERIAYMIDDSQMSVIVTQKKCLHCLPKKTIDIVYLESDRDSFSQYNTHNPISKIQSNHLAYVIYTSGSTGKPKGVQITHQSVTNFLMAMRQTPGLNETDILLAVTTISFDIAVLELYLPLIVGAKTVIVSREIALDGLQLSKVLAQTGATILQATPATWQMLLSTGWEGNSQLKILCGGEALPQKLAQRLVSKSASVWNLYGPTETTVWATIHPVEPHQDDHRLIESIGHPIANTQIYILDTQLQPVPVGIKGQIFIGGVQVARGYLNRPQLTNDRFISNPFSDDPNARLYKTGDLGRYLPDGNIEYLGRIDHQVKLRGFRIELGEIEATLTKHPLVQEAVVLLRENEVKQSYLVGYVVPQQASLTEIELLGFLKEQLPDYMTPQTLVFLPSLPLTPNGKVDRRSLPTPAIKTDANHCFIAPRTFVETVLASIWVNILGVDPIGIDDNFFELGGHSLLATQVISAIRERFQVELPLRQLFAAPTIRQLGEALKIEGKIGNNTKKLPINPVSRDIPLPLSFAQNRLWLFQQLQPDSCAYNIPAAVHLKGNLNLDALSQSMNKIINRHEALRTIFHSTETEPCQVILPSLNFEFPLIDLSEFSNTEQDKKVQEAIAQACRSPFDLTQAPLMRGLLLRLNDEEYIFALIIHHIVTDGWSMEVLIKELGMLYTALSNGEPLSLPPLPIQYADFAVWQRQWIQGDILEQQLAYWKQQLEGANFILPTDKPRPTILSSQSAIHRFTIPKSLTVALNHLSQQEDATLFMVTLAAFKGSLYCYTNKNDILVGSPVANRNRIELEPLIGFFVNTLVMRTKISQAVSFRTLLNQVKEVVLDAYTHQDLPFDRLVKELQLERNLNSNSLYQVWFALHHNTKQTWDLPNLKLTSLDVYGGMARYDLKLSLAETPEGIEGAFHYQPNLFEETTITQMSRLFLIFLDTIIKKPEITLEKLNCIFWTEEKKKQNNIAKQLQEINRQKLAKIKRKFQ
ncbi:amino acid adenylation domain protein (plasmid) [Gloeothece citriformis PCC 7424]|uniref:Amino acid adenylation domain protein n=1 Tax=Gloeothece citriformis (strain PCC 7424) TaxID=65393 RepID=B7KLZ9_GLOC7|nr:non-ribosomal peptide synthetase [Gloeothece citriformis]ACK73821.1 amino acid adenylation domain protein [Gloeothece citriformis PCC 7424]